MCVNVDVPPTRAQPGALHIGVNTRPVAVLPRAALRTAVKIRERDTGRVEPPWAARLRALHIRDQPAGGGASSWAAVHALCYGFQARRWCPLRHGALLRASDGRTGKINQYSGGVSL